jgi:hypothetical protein
MPRLRPAALFSSLLVFCLLVQSVLIPSVFAEAPAADPARSRPQLSLPTPIGERWKIIQGYACGTHNSWDRYSLDLVSVDGRTTGSAVRAAADGVIFAWTRKSGTLILSHGNGFYTMYTHMESAVSTADGTFVTRGTVIGAAGDRGSPGTPHLHFTAFVAEGAWAKKRQSVPLNFAEGYDLPEKGGCSQHQGTVMVAADPAKIGGQADRTAPTLAPLPAPIKLHANQPTVVAWPAARDDGSGVAGYRIYIGPDAQGTSDWFIPDPELEVPALTAGRYLLRVQALDAVGNGNWITLSELIVE